MNDTAAFWKGDFGDSYLKRNDVDWRRRVPFWTHIIEQTGATSFLDVGCSAGWNMEAIRSLSPEYIMSGIDVNRGALDLAQAAGFDVIEGRADEAGALFQGAAEIVVTSGVLIHIAPEDLTGAMQSIVMASNRFVLAIEYDAREEAVVEYRGHLDKLWRRPYGKLYEALGLSLVESGDAEGFNECKYWLLEK